MIIGIVGVGIVGNAVREGMSRLKHTVVVHDIKLDTNLKDVLSSEICYVCVPSPSLEDGSCDTSVVEEVIHSLKTMSYNGIIAIKSTVSPGTTKMFQSIYSTHKICFVPEFLRERFAVADFVEDHDLCAIGTESEEVFRQVRESHGYLPRHTVKLTPTEAEMLKYMNNIHNATLVTLANSFYELCKEFGCNYTKVKDALVNRDHIYDMYLDCNENLRGFGGMCLPKDTRALAKICEDYEIDFFDMLLKENAKYKTTCYAGMRHDT